MEKEFHQIDAKTLLYVFSGIMGFLVFVFSILSYIVKKGFDSAIEHFKKETISILKSIEIMGIKIDITDSFLYKEHNSKYRDYFDNEFRKKLNEAGYVKKND